jgi:signal transduction histidine kinase
MRHCFDTGGLPEDGRNVLDTMQNEALRLGRMVEGMVELSTIDGKQANREKTDFAAMLKSCADSLRMEAEQKQNKLYIDIQADLPYVYAHAEQLQRVPVNLITNAIHFTQGGDIRLSASDSDGYITVKVTDTGSGIPADILPRVFERGVFSRGGEGFGLSICKTIVEAHGGTTFIESEPGGGTNATFTIPVYGGQSEAAKHE